VQRAGQLVRLHVCRLRGPTSSTPLLITILGCSISARKCASLVEEFRDTLALEGFYPHSWPRTNKSHARVVLARRKVRQKCPRYLPDGGRSFSGAQRRVGHRLHFRQFALVAATTKFLWDAHTNEMLATTLRPPRPRCRQIVM
jgi:hypothetical protein